MVRVEMACRQFGLTKEETQGTAHIDNGFPETPIVLVIIWKDGTEKVRDEIFTVPGG